MKKSARVLLAGALCTALAMPAQSYQLLGPRWQDSEVTINYIPIVPGVPLAGLSHWNNAMSEAIDSWAQGAPGLKINKIQATANPCAGISNGSGGFVAPHDGDLSGVAFAGDICGTAWNAGTLAVNVSFSSGGFYSNSDILFNTAVNWDVYSGPIRPNIFDFKRVAVHELGHLFGLGHETENLAIMQPFYDDADNIDDMNMEMPTPDDFEGLNALYSSANSPMAINLEEPSSSQITAGIGNIRGWAVANAGIAEVEIYIDNVLQGNSPYGAARGDVGSAYPNYPNADRSGFSMAVNWSLLDEGPHTIIARAIDNLGNIKTDSGLAIVEKFDTQFVSSADLVKLAGSVSTNGDKVTLDDVMVNNKPYRVELKWNASSQQFDIVNIIKLF